MACPEPVRPDAVLNLVPVAPYDIETDPVIDFGTVLDYACRDGMKFEKDFELVSEPATCGRDNIWAEPNGAWSGCVPSKYYYMLSCQVLLSLIRRAKLGWSSDIHGVV